MKLRRWVAGEEIGHSLWSQECVKKFINERKHCLTTRQGHAEEDVMQSDMAHATTGSDSAALMVILAG